MEQRPHLENAEQNLQMELEGFYLPPEVIKENIESIVDFFGDNRVDEEGRVNWYKMLKNSGVALETQEDYLPDEEDEIGLAPLDLDRALLRATKISEFFKNNLAAQVAYFDYVGNGIKQDDVSAE